jgi:hypothetical protein
MYAKKKNVLNDITARKTAGNEGFFKTEKYFSQV